MKKTLILAAAASVIALFASGCAGVGANNGSPAPAMMGANFYSDVSANSYIQPITGNYKIVKNGVTASAQMKSVFTCVNIGDISYATLKAAALKGVKGADELVNVRIDYKMDCICGVNTITATLTGTAVKLDK